MFASRSYPGFNPSRHAQSILLCLLASTGSGVAQNECHVPGWYSTVQAAIDDPTCTTIALGEQVYSESVLIHRSVEIGATSGTTEMAGSIEVIGSATEATLADINIRSGCERGTLSVSAGARIYGDGNAPLAVNWVTGAPCPSDVTRLFSDNFESGNTFAWSRTVP